MTDKVAKPFLKWAGGKTQLITEIEKSLPYEITNKTFTYIEPFVGSGAVLFWMLNNFPKLEKAVINDINTDLINTYRVIASKPNELISILQQLQNEFHSLESKSEEKKEYYYKKRELYNTRNEEQSGQAALFIFLNRTCFNGLYRVNKNNGYNVPIGSYKKPTICDFLDKISGSVPFNERPEAKKLLQWVAVGRVKEVRVHSIDRLGRSTLDILQTIKHFTAFGVNVVSEKEGLRTLQPDGKENPVAKMMIGILGTLAEFELSRIRERQREGIAKAKERGDYKTNGGHKPKLTAEQFLNKKGNANCANYIKQGYSLRKAARLADVSLGTAQKVSKLMVA